MGTMRSKAGSSSNGSSRRCDSPPITARPADAALEWMLNGLCGPGWYGAAVTGTRSRLEWPRQSPITADTDPRAWLATALKAIGARHVRHPGNLRYYATLGRRRTRLERAIVHWQRPLVTRPCGPTPPRPTIDERQTPASHRRHPHAAHRAPSPRPSLEAGPHTARAYRRFGRFP